MRARIFVTRETKIANDGAPARLLHGPRILSSVVGVLGELVTVGSPDKHVAKGR